MLAGREFRFIGGGEEWSFSQSYTARHGYAHMPTSLLLLKSEVEGRASLSFKWTLTNSLAVGF